MILQLEHIYKDYIQGKMTVPVLKDISLSVDAGEYLAIMGPSGSGKTTLMNIIGCLDRPTSGYYHLNGHDILAYKDNELSDVRLNHIGFVFQSFHLLPKQSALENVALPLIYAGVSKKERHERAAQALERVGLGDRVSFKPTQLSGGQQQRVAIARAIVNHPTILLADEPTGALDSQSGAQVMELFQSLNDEGMTIIMITHDGEIASFARRKAVIRDGILSENPQDPPILTVTPPTPPETKIAQKADPQPEMKISQKAEETPIPAPGSKSEVTPGAMSDPEEKRPKTTSGRMSSQEVLEALDRLEALETDDADVSAKKYIRRRYKK